MGIKITTKTESKEPTEYNGLTWFDTSDAKEQYNNAYDKYKQHYDGFFNKFKGGEKDNIYQEFLNLKDGVSPMDIALDHDLGLDYLKYEHELENNPQAKLDKEHFLKFNSKDKSLIPENFNMDNWISDLNDQSNDVKSYVDSLYNQKRSQRYFNRANRYAKKHGAQNWVTEFEDITDIDYSPHYNSSNTDGKITMGLDGKYPFNTTLAHEIAHGRNLYNKRTLSKHPDSEYYGNDYSYIKNRHKEWLKPENPRDEHDAELSEQYSDLMGLRRSMYDAGIIDGTKRRYRNRDIDRFRETELGKNNRYLEYHSNRRNIRRALNRVYQVGGIMVEPYQWTPPTSKSTDVQIPYRPKDEIDRPKGEIDFSNIGTTNNRAYDPEAISYINNKLSHLSDIQRSIILGTIIEESGGDPFSKSENGTYQGLLQWASDRYRMPSDITDKYKAIDHQLDYLSGTLNNLNDQVSWTHGGSGSKYKDNKEAYNNFQSNDLWTAHRAFSYGYVRPLGKEDSAKNRYDVVKQIYDRFSYKKGGMLKIQNGGFTTRQQEDNKAFFEDFSERYNKLHGVDKSSAIQETLENETPVIDPNGKGNYYNPRKDEINLVSTNSPAHFTHEFVHKLNDSLPPRLERSQEEVDLLTEAYPLGKLQNSTKRYQKYAGKTEHFTTNTTLRRNISDKNNGILGEGLNKIIEEMPAEELGIEAGGSGYASPRDYFEFKPEINSVESYYKAMGNETPWKSLKRKEKKNWNWQYQNKIGIDKIGVPNEELINKMREALIKVASTNNIDLNNHG